MLKKLLTIVGVALIGLVAFIATRPPTYHVERTTTIKAPPEAVYAVISDLHRFGEWSPWDRRDPAMKKTFSGPANGVGASYAWEGNKDVGAGKMTITEAKPPSYVRIRLEFLQPFASVAEVGLDVVPAGTGEVKTTWSMDGHNNFVSKAFSLVMNMDKMIGKDFDDGLASLKHVAEAAPAAPAPTAEAKP